MTILAVIALRALLLTLLLGLATLTALYGKTSARRQAAAKLVHLLLTPSWRRGSGRPGLPQ